MNITHRYIIKLRVVVKDFTCFWFDPLAPGLKPRAHDKGSTRKRGSNASSPALGLVNVSERIKAIIV